MGGELDDVRAWAAGLGELHEEGTALLGPARLDGRHGMRSCVTNYRTTRDDIELIINRLSDLARQHHGQVGGAVEVAL
ncbi:hypothetical protein [Streptomyces sp. NPDC056663]|uniref:hypothetical protein n=1 Tax=Streptomyces sp. NPDC056663 TaxID=3345899 RepID=UPI0036A90B0C